MSRDVLMVAAMPGAEHCARAVEEQLGIRVDLAADQATGLQALERAAYAVVVIEEALIEQDPDWGDQMFARAGTGVPLQVNFAISGCARLAREINAAMRRRESEWLVTRRAVAAEMEDELKTSVTGLLLESELALREPQISAGLSAKLEHLVELAGALRERLRSSHLPR